MVPYKLRDEYKDVVCDECNSVFCAKCTKALRMFVQRSSGFDIFEIRSTLMYVVSRIHNIASGSTVGKQRQFVDL